MESQGSARRPSLASIVKRLDIFWVPPPTFNLGGKQEVRTWVGGLTSLIIMYTALMFALFKLQHLLLKQNPALIKYTEANLSQDQSVLDTSDESFMMAITLETYSEGVKSDPRYVKWIARHIKVVDGVSSVDTYAMHPCSKDELLKFSPSEWRSAGWSQRHMDEENLFCLDWKAMNITLYGTWASSSDYSILDIAAVPCGFQFVDVFGMEHRARSDCVWDKEAVIDYIGEVAWLVTYTNQGRFIQDEYNKEPIEYFSTKDSRQAEMTRSNWVWARIENNEVQDRTAYFQLSQFDQLSFKSMSFDHPIPSLWSSWPDRENPGGIYKFSSLWLELSHSQKHIERQTYSFLEWLGDVGGLYDGLRLIGLLFMAPAATFQLKTELLTTMFHFLPTKLRQESSKTQAKDRTDKDWKNTDLVSFVKQGFWCNLLHWPRSRARRYRKMISRAEVSVCKELDLVKFVLRQRMQTFARLASLSTNQRLLIDKMSKLLIHESSECDEGYSDEELQTQFQNLPDFMTQLKPGHSEIEMRLLNLYRIQIDNRRCQQNLEPAQPAKVDDSEKKLRAPRESVQGESSEASILAESGLVLRTRKQDPPSILEREGPEAQLKDISSVTVNRRRTLIEIGESRNQLDETQKLHESAQCIVDEVDEYLASLDYEKYQATPEQVSDISVDRFSKFLSHGQPTAGSISNL